jgi:hypothetical protein
LSIIICLICLALLALHNSLFYYSVPFFLYQVDELSGDAFQLRQRLKGRRDEKKEVASELQRAQRETFALIERERARVVVEEAKNAAARGEVVRTASALLAAERREQQRTDDVAALSVAHSAHIDALRAANAELRAQCGNLSAERASLSATLAEQSAALDAVAAVGGGGGDVASTDDNNDVVDGGDADATTSTSVHASLCSVRAQLAAALADAADMRGEGDAQRMAADDVKAQLSLTAANCRSLLRDNEMMAAQLYSVGDAALLSQHFNAPKLTATSRHPAAAAAAAAAVPAANAARGADGDGNDDDDDGSGDVAHADENVDDPIAASAMGGSPLRTVKARTATGSASPHVPFKRKHALFVDADGNAADDDASLALGDDGLPRSHASDRGLVLRMLAYIFGVDDDVDADGGAAPFVAGTLIV